jgi:predicted nucleic acid-binding protein
MTGNSILADTNILIYFLQGNQDITDYLNGKDIYTSFISEMELLCFPGLDDTEIENLKRFLDSVKIIDINAIIKSKAINLRMTHKFKLPDSIVMATAGFLNIPLITADKQLLKAQTEINVQLYDIK